MSLHLSTATADLMEAFLAAEQLRVSASGYVSLVSQIHLVLSWFETEGLDVRSITIQDALAFAAWVGDYRSDDDKPYATGTVINYLKTARHFFDYLAQIQVIKTNPFQALRYPRLSVHISRNVLTEAQMGRLLHELRNFDALPTVRERHRRYRVHVIAEFLYASGLRIAEACALHESDLDLAQRLVYVRCGKGDKPRMAFLTGYATEVVAEYVHAGRRAVMRQNQNDDSLFGAEKGRMVVLINQELHAVCSALDLPVITTHGFRHSLGTHLLRAGCDMRYIQVILGHDALSTTQIYTRVDKDDLKRSLDAFHPRQWRTATDLGDSRNASSDESPRQFPKLQELPR